MALLVTYSWKTRTTWRFMQHGQNLAPIPSWTTDTKWRSYSLLQNSSASDHTPLSRHVIVGDIPGCFAYPGWQVYCTVFPTEKSISFLCSSFSSAKCNLVGGPQPPIEKENRHENQAGQAQKEHSSEESSLICLAEWIIWINIAITKQTQHNFPKDSRGSGSSYQDIVKSSTHRFNHPFLRGLGDIKQQCTPRQPCHDLPGSPGLFESPCWW